MMWLMWNIDRGTVDLLEPLTKTKLFQFPGEIKKNLGLALASGWKFHFNSFNSGGEMPN